MVEHVEIQFQPGHNIGTPDEITSASSWRKFPHFPHPGKIRFQYEKTSEFFLFYGYVLVLPL